MAPIPLAVAATGADLITDFVGCACGKVLTDPHGKGVLRGRLARSSYTPKSLLSAAIAGPAAPAISTQGTSALHAILRWNPEQRSIGYLDSRRRYLDES